VHSLTRPLRTLEIPAAGIVDIDILNDGGTNWKNFLEGGYVPEIERHSLSQGRALIEQRFRTKNLSIKKGGITQLADADREAALNVLERLAEYGLFIVPHGEAEDWLPHLGVSGQKERWLPRIFEKMGDDPLDLSYVKPAGGDVWQFLAQVKRWIRSSSVCQSVYYFASDRSPDELGSDSIEHSHYSTLNGQGEEYSYGDVNPGSNHGGRHGLLAGQGPALGGGGGAFYGAWPEFNDWARAAARASVASAGQSRFL
jgi:hypothetical protein